MGQMHPLLKSSLNLFGGALGLAGSVFVVLRLCDHAAALNLERITWQILVTVGLLALFYGFSNIFLARAWWHLLAFLKSPGAWNWTWRAYGISQLAKYLPGNLFHLAGRQAIGMAAGLPGWALAKSAVWELGLISASAAFFGLFVLPLLFPEISLSASLVAFPVVLFAVALVAKRMWGPQIARALGWQTAFLIGSGFVFIGALELIAPQNLRTDMLTGICGAYVVAWLVGFLTPGTPAGVGVREMVLLFLLKKHIADADLLLTVVLCRMVTVTGDLAFFGAAWLSSFLTERRRTDAASR
jgi:uncharacterized membrane protein YbhN (UPF0104 family)